MPEDIEALLDQLTAPEPAPEPPAPDPTPPPPPPPDYEKQFQEAVAARPDLAVQFLDTYRPIQQGTPVATPEEEDDYAVGIKTKAKQEAVKEVSERMSLAAQIEQQIREAMADEDYNVPEHWYGQLKEVLYNPNMSVAAMREAARTGTFVTNAMGVLHQAAKTGKVLPKAKTPVDSLTPVQAKDNISGKVELTPEQKAGTERFAQAIADMVR